MTGGQPAVLIFKLVRDPKQHGGLGIARTLGRAGIDVYTTYEDQGAPATTSRYVTGRFLRAWSTLPPDRVLAELIAISSRLRHRPVLLPIDDLAALFVNEHAAVLQPYFAFPRQPDGLARELANKYQLYELCRREGVAAPATFDIPSRSALVALVDRVSFPVVIKSKDPEVFRARPAAKSVIVVRDREALFRGYDAMEDPSAPNLMLQEHIPGDSRAVWMFNGYFDGQSRCVFGLTGQKLRQTPPDTGATSLGVVVNNDAVVAASVSFLQAVGYRGIVDMGFRYDGRDGQYKLLDVNPRVGSTFRLFVDANGQDVVRALYQDLTTHRPPPVEPMARKWIVEDEDAISSLKLYRRRELTLSGWARSLRGVSEGAWFARDDLRPLAALAAWWARALPGLIVRSARRRS